MVEDIDIKQVVVQQSLFLNLIIQSLSDQVSIFTVELNGIFLALERIRDLKPPNGVILFDSLRSLKAIRNATYDSNFSLVYEILHIYTALCYGVCSLCME